MPACLFLPAYLPFARLPNSSLHLNAGEEVLLRIRNFFSRDDIVIQIEKRVICHPAPSGSKRPHTWPFVVENASESIGERMICWLFGCLFISTFGNLCVCLRDHATPIILSHSSLLFFLSFFRLQPVTHVIFQVSFSFSSPKYCTSPSLLFYSIRFDFPTSILQS